MSVAAPGQDGHVTTRSAGLLVFRRPTGASTGRAAEGDEATSFVEVLLVHPGGPYWSRRDDGWWSIPKGEVDPEEEELAAAEREFFEELGLEVPGGPRLPLGEVRQAGGKRVVAWAVEGDVDVAAIESGTFEMEWPPRSGRTVAFPEVDRAGWFSLEAAATKLLRSQLPFLDRVRALLSGD
jgi:predicted NUDIX family NTP pyrophosphohydrolase